ncbi:MAG: hypothetical protein KatS3mg013_1083 [Actinomycetota bacterium]|nr:MAG: hypothetical protein KatS3mg013_1083 [Actinomycetota bacterium]
MDSQRPTSPSDGWSFGRKRHTGFRRTWWAPVALATAILLITLSLSAVAAAQTAPSISSDKEDYAPGETVTLTGAGWQAGEAVHIRVDDDQERTWSHDADVTADEAGGFTYQFTLPTHFVAVYTVVATGEVSGTATTSFTDGNVEVRNHSTTPAGVTATYKLERWGNTTCSGAPTETKTFSITGPGAASPAGQVSTGNSESIKLTLVSVTGGTFVKWMRDDNPPLTESGALSFAYASGTCLGVASPTQWLIFGVFAAAANQAPVAAPVSVTTNEDTPVSVQLSATDADGNPLTFAIVSNPSNGSLGSIGSVSCSGTAPKTCTASVTYTPNANFHGSDSFTYKANDGTVDSGTATVSITVSSVNDAPVAQDDSYSTAEDTPLNVSAPVGVLGNDSDVDGDSLTAVLVSGPSHGTLTLNANGSFDYTPNANFHGSDSFTYKANDGTVDSGTATVSITVSSVNDAPVAQDDSYSTAEDTPLNVSAPVGVLGNDSDVDGDSLTAVLVSGPSHGTLTLNANGSFDYEPDENYCGQDSFTYKANDGTVDSNAATVGITVDCVNDPPVVSSISGPNPVDESTSADRTYTFTITDPDSSVFTFMSGYPACGVNGSLQGTPSITGGNGSFDCKFSDGQAQTILAVKVTDGADESNESTLLITILNVAPEITPPANQTADEGTSKTFDLGSFTDPGDDSPWKVTVDWGDSSADTVFTEAGPGSITDKAHTYADDGTYTVTITVEEENGTGPGSDQETFEVTVANVAPEITPPANQTADEGTSKTFDLGSFTDPGDDSPWKVTVDWGDSSADTVFTEAGPGSITDKAHTYADDGTYTVTITVEEENGTGPGSDQETFEVTVANVAPEITPPANQTADEGTSKTFDLGSFTDPGDDSPWKVTVDWGDSSADTVFTEAGPGSITDKAHTYADDGTYTVTITVEEENGTGPGSDQETFEVTVANVAPEITPPANQTADEGTSKTFDLGSFTDPGDDSPWKVTVDWGDSSADTVFTEAGPGSITDKAHTYADDGTYTVTITVEEENGTGPGSDQETFEVTVANVAPEITSASFPAATTSCGTGNATLAVAFTDPGADTWLATITWGDGSPAESLSVTPGTFTATHTYELAGVYTANVVVADDDGGSDSASASITVNYTIVGDGFLPPINNTGHGQNPSIFKYGSTIPVKIKVQDCDGSYASNLAPKVYVQKVTNNVPDGGEIEPYSTSAADTGNTMRFTGAPDYQYIFNLATKQFSNDPTSTWKLMVRIAGTSQEISTVIGLKK